MMIIPSAFSMKALEVQKGSSLWSIAQNNAPDNISTSRMIKAIKAVNRQSYPNISENIVQPGQSLAIPTTPQEVKDALTLHKQSQKSYGFQTSNDKKVNTSEKQEQTESSKTQKTKPNPNASQQNVTANNQTLMQAQKVIQNLKKQEQQLLERLNEAKSYQKIAWTMVVILAIALILMWLKLRNLKQSYQGLSKDSSIDTADEPDIGTDTDFQPNGLNVNDVLVEAMVMIDDNDLRSAKHHLQQALESVPDSIEIRIKLLEIFAMEKDLVSFNSERDYLAAYLLPHDDERWQTIDQIYEDYFVN